MSDELAHLPGFVAGGVEQVSGVLGAPTDQVSLVLCLLAALPLGVVHGRLRGETLRHVWSGAWGVAMVYFLLGTGMMHSVVSSMVVFACIKMLPNRIMPAAVTAFAMTYLCTSHLYRIYVDYMGWRMDFSATQMIITLKFIKCAYNVSDGRLLRQKKLLSDKPYLHEQRQAVAVRQPLSALQFFGYAFFYPSVMAGPACGTRQYLDFVDGSSLRKHGLSAAPSNAMAVLACLVRAAVAYAGVMLYNAQFPVEWMVERFDAWTDMVYFVRLPFMLIGVCLYRFKYYFAWYFAEAGCVAAGFGYEGKDEDGRHQWTGARIVNMWRVELAQSLPELTNNWNMPVNDWLKHYVYQRAWAPKAVQRMLGGHKTYAMLITRLMSAFFHGFYPGYYLFFLSSALLTTLDAAGRAKLRQYFVTADGAGIYPRKYAYDIVGTVAVFSILNYFGAAFELLSLERGLTVWAGVHYYGHVLCLVLIVALQVLPSAKRKRK